MSKTYRLHPNIYLLFFICLLFTILAMYFWGNSDLIAVVSLIFLVIDLIFFISFHMLWGRVVVNDRGVVAGARFYFDARRELNWDQIKSIDYTPLFFLKQIRINPIGSGWWVKLSRSITLTILIKNYKDLFREIIMSTYDATKIDPEVVKLVGMTQEELGNRKSTTLIRVIE